MQRKQCWYATVKNKKPYLNLGGSMGSFCISTIRITLCLAPELNAIPCWDAVYRIYWAAWGFCATWVGCAAAIFVLTSFSKASLVFLVVCNVKKAIITYLVFPHTPLMIVTFGMQLFNLTLFIYIVFIYLFVYLC